MTLTQELQHMVASPDFDRLIERARSEGHSSFRHLNGLRSTVTDSNPASAHVPTPDSRSNRRWDSQTHNRSKSSAHR
jgi:hypothetical protein